jgi:competence protein ComEA
VAQRVRAILAGDETAERHESTADVLPAEPAHRLAGAGPWVPGDDFTVPDRPAPRAVQPVAGWPSIPLPPVPQLEARPLEPPVLRPASVLPSEPLPPGLLPPEPLSPERLPPERPTAAGLAERLAARLPVRIDPGRRGAMAVGAAVLVAAVLTGGWVLSSRPHAVGVSTATTPGPAAPAASAPASLGPSPAQVGTSAAPAASPAVLVVDVAGKVRHPGLYRLPAGSRVDDAVQAAGGALPGVDLTPLNLAAKVTDGQQIAVGRPGAASAPAAGSGDSPGAGGAAAAPPGLVDLNSATLEQLETLPGVGPVLGQHILDWRAAHGRFTSVDQLRDVSGIGDVKFAALRSRVTV